jgi:opacity protein-like surface antigen
VSTRALVLVCALAAVVVLPTAAAAQTPITVSFGYAALREQGPGDFPASVYDTGWALSGAYPIGLDRILVAGELGRQERVNIVDETQELTAGLVGARYLFARSGRLTAFGQALVGVERFTEPGFEESGFAFQPGAGLDYDVAAGVGVRVQGDYRLSRQGEATFKDWRFFVGGVYAFRW